MHDHNILNEEERRVAVSMLSGRPLSETRGELFRAMGDPNWRVRKEAVEVFLSADVTEKEIHDLVSLLADEVNAGLRNAASEVLERLGIRALPVLLAQLSDPATDTDTRKFIVDILGGIGDRSTIPILLDLMKERDPNVAAASIEALGRMGDPRVVPDLLSALDTSDLCLAFTILDTLGKLRTPLPLEPLTPLLGNPLLKKAVFDCLGTTGDPSVVPALMEGLKERGRSIRESALTALIRIHDRLSPDDQIRFLEQIQRISGTPLVELLVASLESIDNALKTPLIRLLGMIRDSRALIPLLRLSSVEELADVCRRAISDIGAVGTPSLTSFFPFASDAEQVTIIDACIDMGIRQCEEILVEGSASSNPEVRGAAIRGIGALRIGALVDRAISALDDPDPSVVRNAVRTLVQLASEDGDHIHDEGVRRSSSPDVRDRLAAAHLLSATGDHHRLSLLLKDENFRVRSNAVMAISKTPSPETVSLLQLALIDEAADVRLAAVKALGEIGNLEVTDSLLLLLDDVEPRVQRVVLQTLARLGDPKAFMPLVDYLKRRTGGLLITAMEALVASAGADAAPHLEQYLASDDEEVVKTVITLLSLVSPGVLLANLDQLLSHPHWEVRSLALRALADTLGGDARPVLEKRRESETDPQVQNQLDRLLDRMI
ncbi:MAG: HEAT repeat domain-containing protein [Desulfuromonadia bacterium]